MVDDAAAEQPFQLRSYLAVLRRRWVTIAVVTLLCTGAGLAYSFARSAEYLSTVRILVQPTLSQQPQVGVPTQFLVNINTLPPQFLVNIDTEAQLAQSTPVARAAAHATGRSPGRLLSHVFANGTPNSQVLQIGFSDTSARRAQEGAAAFAAAYLDYRRAQALRAFRVLRGEIRDRMKAIEGELGQARRELRARPPNSVEAEGLRSRIRSFTHQLSALDSQLAGAVQAVDPGSVIQPANRPKAPSGHHLLTDSALGLVLGLLLGVGLAFVQDHLDDRLRGRSDFARALGAPVLATIPRVAAWERAPAPQVVSLEDDRGPVPEAYRELRAKFSVLGSRRGLRTLLVTSPGAGTGKTTTAANLAVALAKAGTRVVLVAADLREAAPSGFLGTGTEAGLIDVLEHGVTLERALHPTPVEGLRFLGPGPVSGRAAELLQSERMRETVAELAASADVVVIDTAPALAVADALTLAPVVDGILLVADHRTTSRAVRESRGQLEQAGGTVVGGVLNRFDPRKAGGEDYGAPAGSRPTGSTSVSELETGAVPRG